MALPKKAILAIMAHASMLERQAIPDGGWIKPPEQFASKCRALARDGLLEAGDDGFFRITKLGALQAPEFGSLQ